MSVLQKEPRGLQPRCIDADRADLAPDRSTATPATTHVAAPPSGWPDSAPGRLAARVWGLLPRGGSLPTAVVADRHRLITVVAWMHLPLIVAVALGGDYALGVGGGHQSWEAALLGCAPVAAFATVASVCRADRRLGPVAAALALLCASAALVWLSGGLIEWHFHYFVVVALVALYQEWRPFAIAVVFVLLSHGAFGGVVSPAHVFNHAAAQQDAARWAAFHAMFIAAECAALLAGWRQQERASDRAEAEQDVRREHSARRRVAEAVAADAPLDEIFRLAASEAAELLGVELGVIARLEGQDLAIVCAVGDHPPTADRVPLESPLALSTASRLEATVRLDYRDLPADGDPLLRRVKDMGWTVAVAAPVRIGPQLWGAIGATTTDPAGMPPGAERRLAEFAGLVSLAIRNAKARARLEAQASSDPLTGLANRRSFEERLSEEGARAARYGDAPLAMALIDLDFFKQINDVHGHQMGDTVLARFAETLRATARPADTVARFGGEEFAWLMPRTSARGAVAACQRLLQAAGVDRGDGVPAVTFSAGVATLRAAGPDDMIEEADRALYRAKRTGRARVVPARPAEEPVRSRLVRRGGPAAG